MSFLDYLTQKGVIKEEETREIAREAKGGEGETDDLLVKRGVDREKLMNLKADYLNVPLRSVNVQDVSLDILKYIPEEAATHYQFAPIGLKEGVLEVGVVDPQNIEARDALQFISSKLNLPFKIFLISQSDFNALMENYKSLRGEVGKALTELETELGGLGAPRRDKEKAPSKGAEMRVVEETPITKIVAVILRHATEGRASDIHIEPAVEKTRVRFRVDGVLYTSLFLPASIHNSVVARIKVLASLRLDEKRKPQDGHFSARIEGRKIDLRVSTFPSYHGEKVVIRILDPERGIKKLEETGLTKENLAYIREGIKRPYGLVLLTGPTGSGKTTTLYAMLNELDREKNNVVSLEDPIEYVIPGVSQSQVRPEIGYTFASGLRHTLRQDPDIIVVGEIRDKETAQLAIQAALTGHLVLATLHTNNTAGVVPRLVDMGIESYLIAPTLILAIAQRLVRVMCPTSKKAIPVAGGIKTMIEKQFEDLPLEARKKIVVPKEVYEAVPSAECPGGTRGRTGIFEVLRVDKEVERAILGTPIESEIMRAARKRGMLTMKEDALLKAFEGTISFNEVPRGE